MSASTARRRLSLLTGSSMLAALVMAGAGGVMLTPTTAHADNECGNPSTNGATADTFQCTGTFGAITYPATNGNLTLQLLNNVTTTTGGVVVTATGTNTVTINRIADSPADSGDPSLTSTSGAGLQVTRATGAGITINLSDNDDADAPLVISGTTAGVLLQNADAPSGQRNTSFTTTNGTITASAGAGIDASSTSASAGNITITNGSAVTGSTYGIRSAMSGTGIITITNNGAVTGTTGAVLVDAGARADINNNATGTIDGVVTLNNTGATTFSNSGVWSFSGDSALSTGVSVLSNSTDGLISTGGAAAVDFNDGFDTFTNAGTLAVGAGAASAATFTLTNLEAWNNSGTIVLGSNAGGTASDGVTNDRVVANGLVFTGSFESAMMVDVDFTADQADCEAAVAADCLDLRDSTVAGATTILVNSVGDFEPGHRIVLVDVGGSGSSTVAGFTLDPETTGFRTVGDAQTVESGPYMYGLIYDPVAQQHVLVTGFNDKAFALSRIGRAASEPWRTATGMWQDRQVDLRDTLAGQTGGYGPGVWLKVARNVITDKGTDVGAGGIEYDANLAQRTQAIVGGVDLINVVGERSAWVVGVTAGKLDSTLEHRVGSDLEIDGRSVGAYASLVRGPMFVDAIFNTADLDFDHIEGGVAHEGAATSSGFQVEGGYRLFEVNDGGVYVEPLAAVTYVKTDVDDLTIGTTTTEFDEASSLRGALGLRIAGGMDAASLAARLSFTGRVWKEFDGENETSFSTALGDGSLIEAGPETLGDVGVNLGLFTPGGRWSANVGYSLKFGDDYQSSDASLGVRFNF